MKILFILPFLLCAACTTTTTTLPGGGTTTVRTVDHKAVQQLEPLIQTFGAGVMQGALDFFKAQESNNGAPGPVGIKVSLP